VDGVAADVAAAARAGAEEVIIECNFWDRMDSPQAWADAPKVLAPVLESAGA
jgi:hypothetical protein